MRLRNKPGAEEKLQKYSQYVVADPEKWKGKWREKFEKNQPLHSHRDRPSLIDDN
mgnify:CR=1 FL=1